MLLERRSRKDGKTNVGTFSKDTIHYFGAPGVKFGRLIGDSRKCGLEISPSTQIGEGFYIGHPYGITINVDAKLGRNVNIHKGCTIGQENRGKRKGVPTIGDRVYLGINSTIAGNVTIGNDVFIASNTFVNQDIPSHSIVIGSPCKVIEQQHATEGYILNLV